MKIYYKKTTGEFVGANAIDKIKAGKAEIEVKEFSNKEWFEFLSENKKKDIYIIDEKLTAKEYPVDVEALRARIIKVSKNYLRNTGAEWMDDLENMPQEIKDMRALARSNVNAALNASEEELNNININYGD